MSPVRFPVCINKFTGRLHIPKQSVRQGFSGNTDLIVGPRTLIIVKPGTSDADIIKSLELTIEGIRLDPQPPPPATDKS